MTITRNETINQLFDAYLNYSSDFDKLGFSLTAGHSYQSFYMTILFKLY